MTLNFKRSYLFFWMGNEKEIKIIDKTTLRINDILTGMFRAVGIKLVDFKIEYEKLGTKNWKNEIVLADESAQIL